MPVIDRLTTALSDRYRLDRELGASGMATVYLAHDLKHDRDVAIKVLHSDLGAAVLPGATFTLGAQVPLFNTSAFASNSSAVNYDVTPDGQRFVFLRVLATPGAERAEELVQITNWAAEVRAKLKGKTP